MSAQRELSVPKVPEVQKASPGKLESRGLKVAKASRA
jgi:hypothetical protein